MAFIPRNKDNGIERVAEVDLNSEEANIPQNIYPIPEITNWQDQAIKVLNILESEGINIYDENRTPGMYLKRGVNKFIPNDKKIKEFLSEIKNSNQPTQLEENPIQKINENQKNIFDFLVNQK